MEGLVEALQSLGLTEGVRLLRRAELREDKQNTGTRATTRIVKQSSTHIHIISLSIMYLCHCKGILYVEVPSQKQ